MLLFEPTRFLTTFLNVSDNKADNGCVAGVGIWLEWTMQILRVHTTVVGRKGIRKRSRGAYHRRARRPR